MDSRSKGLIATIVAVILCGCPGIILCITGAVFAAGAQVPVERNGVNNIQVSIGAAFSMLCFALVLVLIPVVVAFLTLRSKPAPITPGEPIPPAS